MDDEVWMDLAKELVESWLVEEVDLVEVWFDASDFFDFVDCVDFAIDEIVEDFDFMILVDEFYDDV